MGSKNASTFWMGSGPLTSILNRQGEDLSVARSLWREHATQIRSFHVKQNQITELFNEIQKNTFEWKEDKDGKKFVDGKKYYGKSLEGIGDAIFPFDWFEIVTDDPKSHEAAEAKFELPAAKYETFNKYSNYRVKRRVYFRGIPPGIDETYRNQLDVLRKEMERREICQPMCLTILDYVLWDNSNYGSWSGVIIGIDKSLDMNKVMYMEFSPLPMNHPRVEEATLAYTKRSKETVESDRRYWVDSIYIMRAFCEMLQHRGVLVDRIDNPDRPPNRNQRRAAERDGSYVEGEHYTITLRKKLTPSKAYSQAVKGIALKEGSPKRRHIVVSHFRKLVKDREEPLLVPVVSHVRGGKMKGRVNIYDATKLPTGHSAENKKSPMPGSPYAKGHSMEDPVDSFPMAE